MAKNQRATTSRHTKASPVQISNQLSRTVQAHSAVERACLTRTLQIHVSERRVATAVQVAAVETARLAMMCGSVRTTASVLGLEPDEVRRLIRRVERRSPDRRPRR